MKTPLVLILAALVTVAFPTLANEFEAELQEFADTQVKEIASLPAVISAVKKQNTMHDGLSLDQIKALDMQWRSEVGQNSAPLINKVTSNELSQMLAEKQAMHEGTITEIFVMDNKGLNVGQSAVTSDYWQGDEAKWQKTYSMGANAVHISEIEEDESTQMFQSQVSYTVVDESGKAIGAITVGVNVDGL